MKRQTLVGMMASLTVLGVSFLQADAIAHSYVMSLDSKES